MTDPDPKLIAKAVQYSVGTIVFWAISIAVIFLCGWKIYFITLAALVGLVFVFLLLFCISYVILVRQKGEK